MSIKTKIIGAFTAILILSAAQGLYVMTTLSDAGASAVSAINQSLQAVNTAKEALDKFQGAKAFVDTILEQTRFTDSREASKTLAAHRRGLEDEIRVLAQSVNDMELAAIDYAVSDWFDTVAPYVSPQSSTALNSVRQLELKADALEELLSALVLATNDRAVLIQQSTQEVLADTRALVIVMITILLVLTGVVAIWVARDVTVPIAALSSAMLRVADGDHTLETVPARERKDEIGGMSGALEVFLANAKDRDALREQQAQAERDRLQEEEERKEHQRQREEADREKEAAQKTEIEQKRREELHHLANDFEAMVMEIVNGVADASESLKAAADSMTEDAGKTVREADDAKDLASSLSRSIAGASTAADEVSNSITDIDERVRQSTAIARTAVEQANETRDQVAELTTAASQIGEVINLVSEIAEQTNLLALNATIEAARAGEAGKGFSVVAGEVKNLANQTAQATSEISSQVESIRRVTGEAANSIHNISERVHEVDETVSAISVSVEQQSKASADIVERVDYAVKATDKVTDNIEIVGTAAVSTGNASRGVLASAHLLTDKSELLKTRVQTFLRTVREE